MKINNNQGPASINPYKQNIQKLNGVKQTSIQGTDKLEISSKAKDLQQISHIQMQRQEKIESIKTSIANGTYSLDAKNTAKSIIDFYTEK